MPLNEGFDRFEGLAYFGYNTEGEGYDAVVVVGERFIEIRDTNDQPLAVWAPGTFHDNGQDIPLRAYFCGEEWLAPQDQDLQNVLDRFREMPTQGKQLKSEGYTPLQIVFGLLILALILCIIGYFLILPLASRLLSPAITAQIDHKILTQELGNQELCDAQLSQNIHLQFDNFLPGTKFKIAPDLGTPYVRLPSGDLLVDANFGRDLQSPESLASLIQISAQENLHNNSGRALIKELPLGKRLSFLANAQIDDDTLSTAWENRKNSENFMPSLYEEISQPLGNYTSLAKHLENWPDDAYESSNTGIAMTDQEWLGLFAFCETPL